MPLVPFEDEVDDEANLLGERNGGCWLAGNVRLLAKLADACVRARLLVAPLSVSIAFESVCASVGMPKSAALVDDVVELAAY